MANPKFLLIKIIVHLSRFCDMSRKSLWDKSKDASRFLDEENSANVSFIKSYLLILQIKGFNPYKK